MKTITELDVDPQRDDDASPMSTYRCMLRPTWMIWALQHKSKYKSNSISNLKKKIKFFGSHVVVLKRPFRWHINYLCRTDIDEAKAIFFLGIQKLGVRTEFNFVNFELFEKFSYFWVSMVFYSWRPFHWCINF